jgi:ABC transport system ATP-binding/permease protein
MLYSRPARAEEKNMDASRQPVARLRWGSEEFLLYPGKTFKLGRSSENDIVLNDSKVSRSHAELEWNGAGFVLRDLGSINGTSVNGQKLASATRLLRDGDQILLSKLTISYEIIRADSAEPPAGTGLFGETRPLGEEGVYLLVISGPDMGQEYPLWGEMITIGRSSREATWEIRLSDRAVSRPHARLESREDGFYLVDLESVNGTMLNGVPVQEPELLQNGDMIAVGETRLTFHKG